MNQPLSFDNSFECQTIYKQHILPLDKCRSFTVNNVELHRKDIRWKAPAVCDGAIPENENAQHDQKERREAIHIVTRLPDGRGYDGPQGHYAVRAPSKSIWVMQRARQLRTSWRLR